MILVALAAPFKALGNWPRQSEDNWTHGTLPLAGFA
jgi:hypothetical protein